MPSTPDIVAIVPTSRLQRRYCCKLVKCSAFPVVSSGQNYLAGSSVRTVVACCLDLGGRGGNYPWVLPRAGETFLVTEGKIPEENLESVNTAGNGHLLILKKLFKV